MIKKPKGKDGKLPMQCLKCTLWSISDDGRILCYKTCPHRDKAKGNLNKWLK